MSSSHGARVRAVNEQCVETFYLSAEAMGSVPAEGVAEGASVTPADDEGADAARVEEVD